MINIFFTPRVIPTIPYYLGSRGMIGDCENVEVPCTIPKWLFIRRIQGIYDCFFFFTSPVTPYILYIVYMIVTRLFSCRQLITHFTRVVLHSAFSLTRRLSLISHGSGGLILSTLPRFSYNRGGLISLPLNRGYSCLTLQISGSFRILDGYLLFLLNLFYLFYLSLPETTVQNHKILHTLKISLNDSEGLLPNNITFVVGGGGATPRCRG